VLLKAAGRHQLRGSIIQTAFFIKKPLHPDGFFMIYLLKGVFIREPENINMLCHEKH
jgi:hypothetical protein